MKTAWKLLNKIWKMYSEKEDCWLEHNAGGYPVHTAVCMILEDAVQALGLKL